MPRPHRAITIRIPPRKYPRPNDKSCSPRLFALYLVRRTAQAGLLRDGGLTADEVKQYVRQLRREAKAEVALLRGELGRSKLPGGDGRESARGAPRGVPMSSERVEYPRSIHGVASIAPRRKESPPMKRKCSHCQKDFTPQELSREESRGLEAERKALNLEGVLFRYYTCSGCGYADIFVDVHPLDGESEETFHRRRDELETTIRQLHGEKVEVVLVERS
jgi:hypothetical protein